MSTSGPADRSRALVEQVADAIIFADRDGLIRVWNAGAEAVFGYAEHEALGQSLDLIIPERFRSAHWTAFDRAISTGRTKHGREAMTTRAVAKDGIDLYVDLSFALVGDGAGQVLGAVAMARDVTARYRAERELRRRVADLEAQLGTRS
jgi:PAS domain S-box-containing protein